MIYQRIEDDPSFDAFECYRQDRQFRRVYHDYESEETK